MRGIVTAFTVVLILVAFSSGSHAANNRVNCDKMKTAAAAKGFSEFLSCNHKGFADNSFDLGVCRTKAYEKCVTKFGVADAKFGGACTFAANGGDSCLDTLNAPNSIFAGI
jgi:hypothetical protein